VSAQPSKIVSPKRSWSGSGHARHLVPAAVVTAAALVVLAGCGGSSKPAYCADRSALEDSVKAVPGMVTSGNISGLQTQATTIQTDATKLVDSAKSDFPTETTAIKTSVDTLQSAVKALPSSPSATEIAAVGISAAAAVSAVKNFTSATSSECG